MASRWENSGISSRLHFAGAGGGGSKITADGDCSHEIKRRLLLGRKVITNLDSILKSRDITLPTKVHLVKATGFSSSHVWMWELDYKESWVKKNWCFWTVVLEKTLESLRQGRSNQSILKEISPEYSLEGLMLKLKLQYFGHLMQRTDCLEKTLTLGKIEGGGEGDNRGWDGWMTSSTQWTWVWVNSGSWWWTGRPDWTELNWLKNPEEKVFIYAHLLIKKKGNNPII